MKSSSLLYEKAHDVSMRTFLEMMHHIHDTGTFYCLYHEQPYALAMNSDQQTSEKRNRKMSETKIKNKTEIIESLHFYHKYHIYIFEYLNEN